MEKAITDESNFFTIDTTKKFSAHDVNKFPLMSILPLALFLLFTIGGVFLLGVLDANNNDILIGVIILFSLGVISLSVAGAVIMRKCRKWFRLRHILTHGWATVGKVQYFRCDEHVSYDNEGNSSISYIWDMTYSYETTEGQYIEKSLHGSTKSVPTFSLYQKLVIAFFQQESFILTKFTIKRGELKETKVDTDDLSGDFVNHQCSIFPYRFWLYMLIILIFGSSFLFASISLFMQYSNSASADLIIGFVIFLLVSVPFIVAFFFQIIKLFKRIVMLKTGCFVLGKIVAPEFYSGKDTLYYYYKDNSGRVCSGNINNPLPHQKNGAQVIVGYNEKGKSTVF